MSILWVGITIGYISYRFSLVIVVSVNKVKNRYSLVYLLCLRG